jgi:hypothetical protein
MVEVYPCETTDVSNVLVVRHSKWYRVYERMYGDPYEFWSVDEGTPETVKHCFKVIMASSRPVTTDTCLKADSEREPVAWMSVFGVLREITDHKNRKVISITRK